MTWLQLYAFVGVPLILLAMAYGAIKLSDHDVRELERKAGKAKPSAQSE
jgi:hypothetical protein